MTTVKPRLPVFFLSHGAPNAILQGGSVLKFWRKLGKEIKEYNPKGIVLVSAHWETSVTSITASEKPGVIYDFYGFEDELYQMTYDAKTTPELISSVEKALQQVNLPLKKDTKRGYDHGTWSPLKVILPEADIPLVQVSLFNTLNAQEHMNLGKALAPLRSEGYIIIGSGGATHNLGALRLFGGGNGSTENWASNFESWLDDTLLNHVGAERETALINFEKQPSTKKAHPRTEHFVPLIVAAGAGLDGAATKVYQEWAFGSLSLASYKFD